MAAAFMNEGYTILLTTVLVFMYSLTRIIDPTSLTPGLNLLIRVLNIHHMIMNNNEELFNRLKAPQTGATRTLTWITRINSHTYINTVTSTLCKAPAQLLHNLESHFYI